MARVGVKSEVKNGWHCVGEIQYRKEDLIFEYILEGMAKIENGLLFCKYGTQSADYRKLHRLLTEYNNGFPCVTLVCSYKDNIDGFVKLLRRCMILPVWYHTNRKGEYRCYTTGNVEFEKVQSACVDYMHAIKIDKWGHKSISTSEKTTIMDRLSELMFDEYPRKSLTVTEYFKHLDAVEAANIQEVVCIQ